MLTMVYGDFDGPRRRKNKAKQSQSAGRGRKSMCRQEVNMDYQGWSNDLAKVLLS